MAWWSRGPNIIIENSPFEHCKIETHGPHMCKIKALNGIKADIVTNVFRFILLYKLKSFQISIFYILISLTGFLLMRIILIGYAINGYYTL